MAGYGLEFGGAAGLGIEEGAAGWSCGGVAADRVRNCGGRGKLSKKAVSRMNSDIPVSSFLEFRLAFVPECRFLNRKIFFPILFCGTFDETLGELSKMNAFGTNSDSCLKSRSGPDWC